MFESILLSGKAHVVGVDETIGGIWEWVVVGVYVEQQGEIAQHWTLWKAISLGSPCAQFAI